jgi:hypothetical protein
MYILLLFTFARRISFSRDLSNSYSINVQNYNYKHVFYTDVICQFHVRKLFINTIIIGQSLVLTKKTMVCKDELESNIIFT